MSQLSWAGELDEPTWQILDPAEPSAWRETVILIHYLLSGETEQLCRHLDGVQDGGLWMLEARAYAEGVLLAGEGPGDVPAGYLVGSLARR